MKTRLTIFTVFILMSLGGRQAHAYAPTVGSWPSNTFSFRANVSSLVNDLAAQGSPFATTTEARYWVTSAAAIWRERSGANVTITYQGDTSWVRLFWNDGQVAHVTSLRWGRLAGLTSLGGAASA